MNFIIIALLGAVVYYVAQETYKDSVEIFKKSKPKHKCVIIPFPENKTEMKGVKNAEF